MQSAQKNVAVKLKLRSTKRLNITLASLPLSPKRSTCVKAASCIMRCLHNHSSNALEPVSIQNRHRSSRSDAGIDLVMVAWLSWSHRRRSDLRFSSPCQNPSAPPPGSVSAEYVAGSIYDLFTPVRMVH